MSVILTYGTAPILYPYNDPTLLRFSSYKIQNNFKLFLNYLTCLILLPPLNGPLTE